MNWCMGATCPMACACWVNQDQTAVTFWLANNPELADIEKKEQAESTGKKGDCLDLRMLLLGMYKWCRWHHPTAKGAFGTGVDSDVPLFHCSPGCVAALEKWGLASKSCFISLFLSSLVIPLSYSWFIPLPLSQPFVAPLNCQQTWQGDETQGWFHI